MIDALDITQEEQAVLDCKYARSLGEVALQQHFQHWEGFPPSYDSDEYAYWVTIACIKMNLDTPECLLKEE